MPGIGFDTMELYKKSAGYADEARQAVKRAYPLTTYLVMAVVVTTSSQPSTHARIHSAYRAAIERIHAVRQ
eukprot:12659-Pleurochrysis_carterae.AAC.1